jgi:hypothetical protein
MPDNWGFVAAAYGLTAAVLLAYWRRLVRKERELTAARITSKARTASVTSTTATGGRSSTVTSVAERSQPPSVAERSQAPSRPSHPRREPDSHSSLP